MWKEVLIFILLIFSLQGCISQESAGVKVGYLERSGDPEVYARYNKYFEEEGINVTWVPFRGGSSVVKAMISGEIDGGAIGSVPAIIRAASKEGSLKIVAVGQIETKEKPGDVLVAMKDSGITRIEDLQGKKVAVHKLGTTLDFTLRTALEQQGVEEVTILPVKIPNQIPALEKGEVDAVFLFPTYYPYVADNTNVLLTPGDVFEGGVPISIVIFKEEVIDSNPEGIRRFVKAYLRGIKWATENPDKVPEVLAQDIDAPIEVARRIELPMFNPTGRIASEMLDEIIQAIKEYDPESIGQDIKAEEILDFRFL
ncbi:MAG: ABC transporter substrate-binding protein [Candidatus Hydrothermarchaeales archaeon]